MKCHTETRRGRRIIKIKQWKSRRHRRCIERRSLFANSISNLYTKHLSQSIYQESVCCISVALCALGTSVTLRYLRPLRDSVCLICKSFSLSLHISEGLFYYFVLLSFYYSVFFVHSVLLSLFVLLYCKDNSNIENQKCVNYLSINALLACKRCPLSPLLTPFWCPIKHLFCIAFVTN